MNPVFFVVIHDKKITIQDRNLTNRVFFVCLGVRKDLRSRAIDGYEASRPPAIFMASPELPWRLVLESRKYPATHYVGHYQCYSGPGTPRTDMRAVQTSTCTAIKHIPLYI